MAEVSIGVLALQGAFAEHVLMLNAVDGVSAFEVRTPDDLIRADGLVIPGGESTAMGLVAQRSGILEALQDFVISQRKPVFVGGCNRVKGTCAGLIVLADESKHMKEGGQPLIGGLKVLVDRNHFGSQLQSFETELEILKQEDLDLSVCHGVFIRAPVVLKTLDPSVKVLARLPSDSHVAETLAQDEERIVAVQQNQILATAFHPELTGDKRWHDYFVGIVRKFKAIVTKQ
eukprot:gene9526-1760_t